MIGNQERPTAVGFSDVRPSDPKVEIGNPFEINLREALRRRPLLALCAFVLPLIAGLPFLRNVPREYHAETTLYISPTYFKNILSNREPLQTSYDVLVNQQILTIRRNDVLKEALTRLQAQGIAWREPGESEQSAIARLSERLEIQQVSDSYEVSIGMTGRQREWLAPIVNTVASTYLKIAKTEESADRAAGLAALTAEKATIKAEIERKMSQQAQLSRQLSMADSHKGQPVEVALLNTTRQALDEARRKRMEAETQLAVMEGGKTANGKSALAAAVEENLTHDSNLHAQTNLLMQRSLEIKAKIDDLERQGIKSTSPVRQGLQKQYSDLTDQIARLTKGAEDETAARLLTKARADVERSRALEQGLSREAEARANEVRAVTKSVQDADGLAAEIDRLRQNESTVGAKIDQLTEQTAAPAYLRIFSSAIEPIEPSKTGLKRILFLMFAAALLFAVGVPSIADLIDQRIYSPSDVKRAIGFEPVGVDLERSEGTRAFADEHLRRVVNGIQRGMRVQNARTILMTPVNTASIPSQLVSDIGRALVTRGVRTVIIKVASRSSGLITLEPHPMLDGASDDRSNQIAERNASTDLNEAQAAPAANMSLVLERLSREYDLVLIDAPPVLLSSDTEFLASNADITMVVVEAGKATRRELIQVARWFGRIGVPCMGVIMSHVRVKRAGAALRRDYVQFSSLLCSNTVTETGR